jgi:hypothetical protein
VPEIQIKPPNTKSGQIPLFKYTTAIMALRRLQWKDTLRNELFCCVLLSGATKQHVMEAQATILHLTYRCAPTCKWHGYVTVYVLPPATPHNGVAIRKQVFKSI